MSKEEKDYKGVNIRHTYSKLMFGKRFLPWIYRVCPDRFYNADRFFRMLISVFPKKLTNFAHKIKDPLYDKSPVFRH